MSIMERETQRASPDMRSATGPFDIIGDVHGCATELEQLLGLLGYRVSLEGQAEARRAKVSAPPGRRAIFAGDLVDRGPRVADVLRIIMAMIEAGSGFTVLGNHDLKLLRHLRGKEVKLTHGFDRTVSQLAAEPAVFQDSVRDFLARLPIYLWLEGGALAVAHAGIKEHMLGETSGSVTSFCLYGETSGETDKFGLPIRYHWAAEYSGTTSIVYGHTPVPEAAWVNNTLCIDTGCCFGGKLSALRWPEREIVSVPALATYIEPTRPFGHPPPRPGAVARSEE